MFKDSINKIYDDEEVYKEKLITDFDSLVIKVTINKDQKLSYARQIFEINLLKYIVFNLFGMFNFLDRFEKFFIETEKIKAMKDTQAKTGKRWLFGKSGSKSLNYINKRPLISSYNDYRNWDTYKKYLQIFIDLKTTEQIFKDLLKTISVMQQKLTKNNYTKYD